MNLTYHEARFHFLHVTFLRVTLIFFFFHILTFLLPRQLFQFITGVVGEKKLRLKYEKEEDPNFFFF